MGHRDGEHAEAKGQGFPRVVRGAAARSVGGGGGGGGGRDVSVPLSVLLLFCWARGWGVRGG
jgi:hypothetical protein